MSDRAERRRIKRERENQKVHTRLSGQVANGRECILELRLSHPGETDHSKARVVRAIIDTGATNSAIREDIALSAGLPVIGTQLVDTASTGGKAIPCDTFLGKLWLGQPIVTTVKELTVMPLKDEMLFGMDALLGGILTVDMVAGIWSWELPTTSIRRQP